MEDLQMKYIMYDFHILWKNSKFAFNNKLVFLT